MLSTNGVWRDRGAPTGMRCALRIPKFFITLFTLCLGAAVGLYLYEIIKEPSERVAISYAAAGAQIFAVITTLPALAFWSCIARCRSFNRRIALITYILLIPPFIAAAIVSTASIVKNLGPKQEGRLPTQDCILILCAVLDMVISIFSIFHVATFVIAVNHEGSSRGKIPPRTMPPYLSSAPHRASTDRRYPV